MFYTQNSVNMKPILRKAIYCIYMYDILYQALIMARSDKEALEVQVNRLQHKVKDLGEDYRMRLIKYVEDISVSMKTVIHLS